MHGVVDIEDITLAVGNYNFVLYRNDLKIMRRKVLGSMKKLIICFLCFILLIYGGTVKAAGLTSITVDIKGDLEKVIKNLDTGKTILESFNDFNEKYNNKIVTLFNQTLELFDEHGNSDANTVLHIISEEMNMLKIKKDKFLKFKKEWRLNFYVVVFLCLSMPIILKWMIPSIYVAFMYSFGKWVMTGIFLINLFIIKKTEAIYRNQSIGEGGSR